LSAGSRNFIFVGIRCNGKLADGNCTEGAADVLLFVLM
jgi:hypothetical protein